MMKISVVVPAYNEEKLIQESLRSITAAMRAFADAGCESELIVCDNNSTDRTAELARAAGATVVFEPINQIARARNCGAAAATGDWLVFVDADSHPSEKLFGEAQRAMASGKYIYGGSTIKLEGVHLAARTVNEIWNLVSRSLKLAAGSFLFCERNAFEQISGFSKELFVSEELDLCNRLKVVAKGRRKKGVILSRFPMTTSGRKLELYSNWEHLSFFLRSVFGRGKTFRRKEDCNIWYDSRR